MRRKSVISQYRHLVLMGVMLFGFLLLLGRVTQLQLLDHEFLQSEADARHLRVVPVAAHRGMITDRNGEPLAISTPVQSIWANPRKLLPAGVDLYRLASVLDIDVDDLRRKLTQRKDREFVYLRRHLPPDAAQQAMDLGLPGVYQQGEYHRYYPAGEVVSHLIGFTNIDDQGQEGIELAYDQWLAGEAGAKRVIKDGRRNIVEGVENIRTARPGKSLSLSIDRRIQYLAYRELKAAVQKHNARSGSLVVLDNRTGEVLALVNQPSYNPNNRKQLKAVSMRNRALTDVFEPGSTMKPFLIAAALESGKYRPASKINTQPGFYMVGSHTVKDMHDYGTLDLTGVIRKSSNVAASKIALSLQPESYWKVLFGSGFGVATSSGFPGEADGYLADFNRWRKVETATLSYGYGLSVSTLQLAQSYAVFANDGWRAPISLLMRDEPAEPEQILSPSVARSVRTMMEAVVKKGGTAIGAAIKGYHVAGKTGTVHKSISGGYSKDKYLSLFAGMAPASNPRLVMAVVIDEPRNGEHFGGKVAGPVFSRVMSGALRLLNVAPDDSPLLQTRAKHPGAPT